MPAARTPTLVSVVRTLTARLGRPTSDRGRGDARVVRWTAPHGRSVTVTQGARGVRVASVGWGNRSHVGHVRHPRDVAAAHWFGHAVAMLTVDTALELAALALG